MHKKTDLSKIVVRDFDCNGKPIHDLKKFARNNPQVHQVLQEWMSKMVKNPNFKLVD